MFLGLPLHGNSFDLQLQLVQQWLPVQTEPSLLLGLEAQLLEGNHFGPAAPSRDLPVDGQGALPR